MLRRLLLPILLILTVHTALAGNVTTALSAAVGTEAMAGESVYSICTDHNGEVWIATANGVSKYNGLTFSTYGLTDPQHQTVTVYDVCELDGKSIYAATDIGLFRLQLGREKFQRVFPQIKEATVLLAHGKTLFVGSPEGLFIVNDKQLTTTENAPQNKNADNMVRHLTTDEHGNIWMLSRYNLYQIDTQTFKRSRIPLSDRMGDHEAFSKFDIAAGKCFVGTRGDGLYVYDIKTKQTAHLTNVGNYITSVKRSGDNHSICIATDGAGAVLIDAHTLEKKADFGSMQDGDRHLPTNALNYYHRDRHGVDWFGMIRYGLIHTYYVDPLFKPYALGQLTTQGMNVRSFLIGQEESLIGTQNGLYFLDLQHQRHHYYSPEQLGGHIVTSIAKFRDEYYIGTFDGCLKVLNPKTLILKDVPNISKLDNSRITELKTDRNGNLWIASSNGLFIINHDQTVTNFTENNSSIVGGLLTSIIFNKKGDAWLTGAAGISCYSSQTRQIMNLKYPQGFFADQPWMRGTSGHGDYVFMRNGPQIFYTNSDFSDFGELKLPIILKDTWTRNLIDDNNGHYWVASNQGLFRFSYENERDGKLVLDVGNMIRFGDAEGLHGDFINDMALTDSNRLYVATSEGVYSMAIANLDSWTASPKRKVRLFDIRRGSDLMTQGQEYDVNEHQKIVVDWFIRSEALQFHVVLPDYAKQSGRIYEYSLDGRRWEPIVDGNAINLRSLMLGTHELAVRVAGMSGTTANYTILVKPSAAFLLFAFLMLVAGVLLVLWRRYKKNASLLLSERDEIEEALIEVEKKQEQMEENIMMDDAKSEDEKYARVKINEQECEEIVNKLRAYLEQTHAYTDTELKMKDLAEVLHLSVSKLSQVFNVYLKESYYEFINRYRLQEFKRLIDEGEYKRYTITALSEKCGFRKSNFFSTFRRVEGMTPAEYLKKKGIRT